jgi:uncharacterized surface protein with fasciclin (FAS1) repeats
MLRKKGQRNFRKSIAAGVVALSLASVAATAASAADIVDTAISAGKFKTLVAALQAAGLEDMLRGPGPYTIFAPTDDAFAKLPAGTVENLLKPENKAKLIAILTYHVVPGKLLLTAIRGERIRAKTPQGEMIEANALEWWKRVKLNDDAKIVKTDNVDPASNGAFCAIDTVLMPD